MSHIVRVTKIAAPILTAALCYGCGGTPSPTTTQPPVEEPPNDDQAGAAAAADEADAPEAATEEAAAKEAAKAWLALVDAEEYQESWQEAAPFFKERIQEDQWAQTITSVRGPLGKVESRELLGAQSTTTLPGSPDGEYVVFQFKTRFAEKADSVETITPMKVGESWRVSGYFIK